MATETQVGAAAPDLTPRPEHKFTFGLWTVGHKGNDPFGEAARLGLRPVRNRPPAGGPGRVRGLLPRQRPDPARDARPGERERILSTFPQGIERDRHEGLDGHSRPVRRPRLKDGAFTSNDRVAPYPIQKTCAGSTSAPSSARRSTSPGAAARPSRATPPRTARDAIERFREADRLLLRVQLDKRLRHAFGIEPKPNEPRGDIYSAAPSGMPRLHRTARVPRDVRGEPRVRPRDDGRPQLPHEWPRRSRRTSSSTST